MVPHTGRNYASVTSRLGGATGSWLGIRDEMKNNNMLPDGQHTGHHDDLGGRRDDRPPCWG